ncbi:MAG: hypothetical protein ACYDCQ_20280 [Dehalococcoidia bacterium]
MRQKLIAMSLAVTTLCLWAVQGGAFNLVRQQVTAPAIVTAYRETVVAVPDGPAFPCRAEADPSCADAGVPWWQHRDTRQSTNLVQYQIVAPGLVTEDKFVAAIALLWQWPEGQAVLRRAATAGVTIGTTDKRPGGDAIASYQQPQRRVVVLTGYAQIPTALLADLLAHELRHAVDYANGTNRQMTARACIADEQAAVATEQRYLLWLTGRFGRLPLPGEAPGLTAQAIDRLVFLQLLGNATPSQVASRTSQAYHDICGAWPLELPIPPFPLQFSLSAQPGLRRGREHQPPTPQRRDGASVAALHPAAITRKWAR